MNLGQFIDACERRTGFNDSTFRSTWRDFINGGVREFARKHPWPGLEGFVDVISPGGQYLILPHHVDQVISVVNKTYISPVDRSADHDRSNVSSLVEQTAGPAYLYDKIGIVPVLKEPTSAISFFSSSASDINILVSVVGLAAASGASGTAVSTVMRQVSTYSSASSGKTKVTLTDTFSSIVAISKATETAGEFYFLDSYDNTHISYIPANETEASFKRLHLIYAPVVGDVFTVRYRQRILPLVDETQCPHPAVDPDFVIACATATYYRSREQFSKGEMMDRKAMVTLQDQANKEENFDEPFQQVTPYVDPPEVEYSDAD